MSRLLFDGKPCDIVGWADEDGRPVIDLLMEDGTARWTYWPTHRLQLEEATDVDAGGGPGGPSPPATAGAGEKGPVDALGRKE